MKALILVGGYGTRLRPLTLTRPKPLVEFCNLPILFHQMDALINCGVDGIILAINYMCEMLEEKINAFIKDKNVKVFYSKEDEPLGTAGPIALAKKYIEEDSDCPFFVLNSDIICLYPFQDALKFHKEKRAEATIVVAQVEDPSKYGVVLYDDNGKVNDFIEKPSYYISNRINAGIYILQPSILKRIQLRPMSIEKEVFPFVAKDGTLYCYLLKGFWMDIGQPKDYLIGIRLFTQNLEHTAPQLLGSADGRYSTGLIHKTAHIGEGCHIGKDVVIGENVIIGDGVCLINCAVLSDTVVKSYSYIEKSIIGWKCKIGKWTRIQGNTILGEDVMIKDELYINDAKILPHKSITESIFTAEIIM